MTLHARKSKTCLYYFLFYRFLFSEGGAPSDTPDGSEAPEDGVRDFYWRGSGEWHDYMQKKVNLFV